MELVAAGLAAETLEQQLPAEVAEGQREEGLPHLQGATATARGSTGVVLGWFKVVLGSPGVVLGGSRPPHTHKVVRCQRNILQNLHVELLSRQPRDVRVPANRLLLPEGKKKEHDGLMFLCDDSHVKT